jgi:hypothetical protein
VLVPLRRLRAPRVFGMMRAPAPRGRADRTVDIVLYIHHIKIRLY